MLDKSYYGVPAILTHYYYNYTEFMASFGNLNMLGVVHTIKLYLLLWLRFSGINRVLVILLQINYLDFMAWFLTETFLPFY